jgi:hypothetical protein
LQPDLRQEHSAPILAFVVPARALRLAGTKPERDARRHTTIVVIPSQAGIQYAAASRIDFDVSGILDHPLSRMMTAESAEISNRQTHLHLPAARSVRVGAENIRPKQRAWGMPGARCTRSRAWCVVNTRVSHHGYTGSPGIPARNGFNGFLRALLGDRALLSPSLTRIAPQSLTPASGRQDHTTSPSASACPRQKRRRRPSHPSPRP